MAKDSIIGERGFHLSVPYLRTRRGSYGSPFRRPTARELRAGIALGHPRPDGRDAEPAQGVAPAGPRPADPGTQTKE